MYEKSNGILNFVSLKYDWVADERKPIRYLEVGELNRVFSPNIGKCLNQQNLCFFVGYQLIEYP